MVWHWKKSGEIKIRTAHKIMAARAAEFAFLVDQLVAALRAKTPVFARNIFSGGHRAG